MTPLVFDKFQFQQGWSDRTLLVLLGRYLNETEQLGDFAAFLTSVVEGEEAENA